MGFWRLYVAHVRQNSKQVRNIRLSRDLHTRARAQNGHSERWDEKFQ